MIRPDPENHRWRARRALDRLAGGPLPGQERALASGDVEAWIAAQIHAPTPPPPSLDWLPANAFARPEDPEQAAAHRRLQREIGARVLAERIDRALAPSAGLHDALTAFWSNHFTVSARKPFTAVFVPHYEAMLYSHARESFHELLRGAARSPAMLFYLDNFRSAAASAKERLQRGGFMQRRAARRTPGGLNENYARELLELHTLGVDGGYDQTDVEQVARAFTGWTIRRRGSGPTFQFERAWHDDGAKRALGLRLRSGGGVEDGEQILAHLARHPSTAQRIARRLAVRFLADDPPQAALDRTTRAFLSSNGDIRATVEALLLGGPELFDPSLEKLKTPTEWWISSLRGIGARLEAPMGSLRGLLRLGEMPYLARSPAGHPDVASAWAGPGDLSTRAGLAFHLAAGRVPGVRLPDTLPAPADLLADPVRDETRRALQTEGLGDPDRIALALASPEFQRR